METGAIPPPDEAGNGYQGAAIAGAVLATLFFPFISLIAALLLQGSQTDPRKKSQLRTWAWASGGLLVLDLLLVLLAVGAFAGSSSGSVDRSGFCQGGPKIGATGTQVRDSRTSSCFRACSEARRRRGCPEATLLRMAARADTPRTSTLERSWWLRAPAVLVAPRAVFVSLRDDSEEAVEARQEPITALAALAGIAGVLATPVARTLLNDGSITVSVIPVWAFFGGMVYAIAVYWLGGGLLFGAARRFGSLGSYRRSRHLLALSGAPVALTLFTVWPIRIAIYGENLFRTGGPDWGPGDRVFGGLIFAAFAWSAVLLLLGVRSVHGWSWGRSLATIGLAAALPVLLVVATHGFGPSLG